MKEYDEVHLNIRPSIAICDSYRICRVQFTNCMSNGKDKSDKKAIKWFGICWVYPERDKKIKMTWKCSDSMVCRVVSIASDVGFIYVLLVGMMIGMNRYLGAPYGLSIFPASLIIWFSLETLVIYKQDKADDND